MTDTMKPVDAVLEETVTADNMDTLFGGEIGPENGWLDGASPFPAQTCELCGDEEGEGDDTFDFVGTRDEDGTRLVRMTCAPCGNRIRVEAKGFDPDVRVPCSDCGKTSPVLHHQDIVCVGKEGRNGDYKVFCKSCRDWREEAWKNSGYLLVSISDEGKKGRPYRVVADGVKFHMGAFGLSATMLSYSFFYLLDGLWGYGKAQAAWQSRKRRKAQREAGS